MSKSVVLNLSHLLSMTEPNHRYIQKHVLLQFVAFVNKKNMSIEK